MNDIIIPKILNNNRKPGVDLEMKKINIVARKNVYLKYAYIIISNNNVIKYNTARDMKANLQTIIHNIL